MVGEALAAAGALVVAETLVAGVAVMMRTQGTPMLTARLRVGCSDGSAGTMRPMRSRIAASTPGVHLGHRHRAIPATWRMGGGAH